MSVDELQTAISQRLSQWFEEYLADQWDRRIESDILVGRLEPAGERADQDFEAGRCTPFP